MTAGHLSRLARLAGRMKPERTSDSTSMDASLYFRLTDRIDEARSREELASIAAEIELTQPHVMERRALHKRLNRREALLTGGISAA
jgi:hypothetical protein